MRRRSPADSRTARSPAWSPDGRRIAFASYDCAIPDPYYGTPCGDLLLGLMDPDGTNRVTLPFPSGVQYAWDLSWSPDGTRLAFTCRVEQSDPIGDTDVCVMSADGRNLVVITGPETHDMYPSWSPDGRRIVFQISQPLATSRTEHPYRLAVMDADGANLRLIGDNLFGMSPSWSPDGSWIVFTGYFGEDPQNLGVGGVRMVDAGGNVIIDITDRSGDYTPVWRR